MFNERSIYDYILKEDISVQSILPSLLPEYMKEDKNKVIQMLKLMQTNDTIKGLASTQDMDVLNKFIQKLESGQNINKDDFKVLTDTDIIKNPNVTPAFITNLLKNASTPPSPEPQKPTVKPSPQKTEPKANSPQNTLPAPNMPDAQPESNPTAIGRDTINKLSKSTKDYVNKVYDDISKKINNTQQPPAQNNSQPAQQAPQQTQPSPQQTKQPSNNFDGRRSQAGAISQEEFDSDANASELLDKYDRGEGDLQKQNQPKTMERFKPVNKSNFVSAGPINYDSSDNTDESDNGDVQYDPPISTPSPKQPSRPEPKQQYIPGKDNPNNPDVMSMDEFYRTHPGA